MVVAQSSVSLVERKLGQSTGRLYAAVQRMLDVITDRCPLRDELARLSLDILCGRYHDYRSGSPMPKADLVDRLRAMPAHSLVDGKRQSLIDETIAGNYDDGESESRRYAAALVANGRGSTSSMVSILPREIKIPPDHYRLFVWLYRYVEVYGVGPLRQEIIDGVGMAALKVADVLRRLEMIGAVVGMGGPRGWLPTRSP